MTTPNFIVFLGKLSFIKSFTMSKVTNNENMRRYVHMKLSNGGSGSGSGSDCQCLPPMIVEGTVNENMFTPDEDAPTFEEAYNHMAAGGLVYLKPMFDSTHLMIVIPLFASSGAIVGSNGENTLVWSNPLNDGGDEGGGKQ